MANVANTYKVTDKIPTTDYLFYFATILLAASIFGYLILNFKADFLDKRIEALEINLLNSKSSQQHMNSEMIVSYKKKIDDFDELIDHHKITSNIFTFVEEKTLSNVWFSSFNIQSQTNEVNVSGQAQNMETLIRQVEVFERSKDYVKSIDVLNSQSELRGVTFTLQMLVDPKIFKYGESFSEVSVNEENSI